MKFYTGRFLKLFNIALQRTKARHILIGIGGHYETILSVFCFGMRFKFGSLFHRGGGGGGGFELAPRGGPLKKPDFVGIKISAPRYQTGQIK
ncbi:MAG: hypothetical protein LBI94_07550, partial [Treponema sp.]|nr:hypothetical protein [Treponema sp.]